MVTKGRFVVQLVHAETKAPLKEFATDSGWRHYVEAEPGLEYYLKVKVLPGKGPSLIYISFQIDGKDLDTTVTRSSADEAELIGAYTYLEEYAVMKAFRFEAPRFSSTTNPGRRRSLASSVGSVRVTFAKAIIPRKIIRDDWHEERHTADTPELPPGGPKVLRSQPGSHMHVEHYGAPSEFWQGKKLETITINYCTAVGLIDAGILPEPPFWESAQNRAARNKEQDDPAIAALVATKVHSQPVTLDTGEVVIPGKVCDLFDITHLDSADDSLDDELAASPVTEKPGAVEVLKDSEPEKDATEDGNRPQCLDLRRLLHAGALPRPDDEYQKAVDRSFFERYHGMPRPLFGKNYKRERIWEAHDGLLVPKKMKRSIRNRITSWGSAICCEANGL